MKIAIVAVHGVGKHLAGETQNAMADLLLSLPARGPYESPRNYTEFVSIDLQIPLQPVKTIDSVQARAAHPLDNGGTSDTVTGLPNPPDGMSRLTNLYQEQSATLAARAQKDGDVTPGQAGLDWTDVLLSGYRGGQDGNVYRTARLQGKRLRDNAEVHIYEVLWADLAKPNNTVITFFLSLFQLILHLASLSRLAIDTGAGEGKGRVWSTYRTVQRWAVRLLQAFIPPLELLLLISLGPCVLEVWLTTSGQLWTPIALGVLGAIALGTVWILNAKRAATEGPRVWAFRVFLLLLTGVVVPLILTFLLRWLTPRPEMQRDISSALLFWLIPGFGLFYWILNQYEDARKGVFATGMAFFAIGLVTFLIFLWQADLSVSPDTPLVVLASLWTGQVILGVIRFFWGLMAGCAIAASLLGSVAWRQMKKSRPKGDQWGRARAAVRTSRLALALPLVSFLLVTLMIWAAFLSATRQLMPENEPIFSQAVVGEAITPSWYAPLQRVRLLPPKDLTVPKDGFVQKGKKKEGAPPNDYALRVFAWTMGYHLPLTLLFVALTSFLLVWWVLPSVLSENTVPRGKPRAPRDASDAVSLRMGTWMSRGLDATTVVTLLLWSAVFLLPILYTLTASQWPLLDDVFGPLTFSIVTNTVVGFTLLAAIAKGGQTVLATLLDVDTYLRSTPVYATPRATIFERYISTLRYLRSYQDENNHGYDSIVIVAHSLGALISGDLLYYLQSERGKEEWHQPDPAKPSASKFTSIPITLLTMGNPTRQLLNRFFPYLYDWVRPGPDNGKCPLPDPMPFPDDPQTLVIEDTAPPDPASLGLICWINAYRSGDYVGRSLWLDEWYHRPAYSRGSKTPHVISSRDGKRHELCIGAGAHVHYMDDTAPDIASLLDSLL
ncbi:MAG: hypothetical protein WCD57_19890 [Acidobacteriaceae bacterium]